ncbi:MAG TPA: DUF4331 domain-containing protein [Solirubrobacteraceae bacterium]|nr:DUF4331 domain-containing protein [Solirubrobacteraceae bacterium]
MRKLSLLAMPVAAALAAGVIAVAPGSGSSHREASLIALDPTADNTDVYAFTAADAPDALTVVANWIPFEDPAGGPNFYRFDDRAKYWINVDNTGDGVYDVRYRFAFKTRYRNPDSFLYALPGVSSISDPKLNIVQTYSVWRETYEHGRRTGEHRVAAGLPVAPNNVGPKTIPNYHAVAAEAVRTLPGGGKVFAGQADDPFFADLGGIFDGINLRSGTGNAGGGKDDLAGYNTHAIVLQVPEAHVTRNHRPVASPSAPNAVVGVWSSTDRPGLKLNRHGKAHDVQVSRLGNPLVNEVVVPVGKKDLYNRTQPSGDLKNFGAHVVEPELAKVLNALFPGLDVPETDRTDIVQALLTGIPGLTQIAEGAPPTDTLKINLGSAPSAMENRFGVIGGDTSGFPNGRRLADDVTDAELRVVGGFLKGNKLPLGDGVDQNDVPFRAAFPYVAPPHAGFDAQLKRLEPAHAPTPPDPAHG